MFPENGGSSDGDSKNQDQNNQLNQTQGPVINDVSPAQASNQPVGQAAPQPTVITPQGAASVSQQSSASGANPGQNPNIASPFGSGATPANTNPALAGDVIAKPPRNKKLIIALVAVGLFVVLGAGYAFGFYLPNKPENVYKTAFTRTNKAFDKVVANLTDKNQVSKLNKSEVEGKLEGEAGGTKFSIDLSSKNDKSRLDLQASASLSGEGFKDNPSMKLNILSEIKEGSDYPDIYFKINGLKLLTDYGFSENILSYDNTWVLVDSNYLKKTIDSYKEAYQGDSESNANLKITAEDINEVSGIVRSKVGEYVFTNDQSKAVFKQKRFVGKEKTDDIDAFRYEMYISKDNFVDFCKAISNDLYNSKAYKRISGESENAINDRKKSINEDCESSAKDINEDNTFDMWIDARYKLIHKIQITDGEDVIEFGQTYKGGDSVRLFMNGHDKDGETKYSGYSDINFKAMTSNSELSVDSSLDNSKTSIKLNLTTKTTDKDVVIDRPKEAKSFEEFSNTFFGGLFGDGSSSSNTDPLDLQELEYDFSQEFDVNQL